MAYTDIDDPSAYFQNLLWTGNNTDGTALTFDGNSDMQPDFVWVKHRNGTGYHGLFDSVRGVTKRLHTNTTGAEGTVAESLQSFNSNGFTVGNNSEINGSSKTYVGWNWKAGTSFSNSAGANGANLASTGSVSTTAGFSIVSFTGNRSTTRNIYHGLGAVPKMIIFKNRSTTNGWTVYNEAIGNANKLTLNSTNASGGCSACFASTNPTSTLFSVGDDSDTNGTSNNMIAYCFADVKGYSKISSYKGTGSNNFIYTGFKVGWLLVKVSDGTNGWLVIDTKRSPANPQGKFVYANANSAEGTVTYGEFFSNGFGWKGTNSIAVNQSGKNYVYMAFAENPFVTSTGIPATAR